MKNQLKILGEGDKIIIPKRAFVDFNKDRTDEVKERLISIKPTRLNNIMWRMSYDAHMKLPADFIVYYFGEDMDSISMIPKVTAYWNPTYNEQGKLISHCVDSGSSPEWGKNEKYAFMGFDSRNIQEDFEFSVEVFLKYTYIINAGRFQSEVSFDDGLLHHDIGDRFGIQNNTENEFVVMNIDNENGLVYCGAIGYNL